MDFFFDLFPVIFFFLAYKFYGIYVATGVLIAATLLQNIVHYLRHKKFNKVHLATLALTTVFGGLTIFLQNPDFIKWKPTIIYAIFAIVLLLVPVFTGKNLIERMMSKQFQLPSSLWSKLNFAWATFFIFMAVLNLYVAFSYKPELGEEARMANWVFFKTWITTALMFIFTIGQMFFLYKYIQPNPESKTEEKTNQEQANQEKEEK